MIGARIALPESGVRGPTGAKPSKDLRGQERDQSSSLSWAVSERARGHSRNSGGWKIHSSCKNLMSEF
jgi:hypothetical protein